MEEDFKAILLASAPVVALVARRIDWGSRVQGEPLPAVVLTVISDNDRYLIDRPHGLSDARVQVDCHGDDYSDAKRLARAVREALGGYRGGIFRGVFHEGTRDGREGGANEADRPFRMTVDFTLTYQNKEA